MRVHLDVLGWLHTLAGATGVLTGIALGLLALGTVFALDPGAPVQAGLANPVVWLLVLGACCLLAGGAAMMAIGRALRLRHTGGRRAALVAAACNLPLLPFGTALGIYTFWALVNDEARREFGRPPRAPLSSASV